jgi:hypothetical protein
VTSGADRSGVEHFAAIVHAKPGKQPLTCKAAHLLIAQKEKFDAGRHSSDEASSTFDDGMSQSGSYAPHSQSQTPSANRSTMHAHDGGGPSEGSATSERTELTGWE